jgi:hypothetical protein
MALVLMILPVLLLTLHTTVIRTLALLTPLHCVTNMVFLDTARAADVFGRVCFLVLIAA